MKLDDKIEEREVMAFSVLLDKWYGKKGTKKRIKNDSILKEVERLQILKQENSL